MNKNKIVGFVDLFLGVIQLLSPLFFLLLVFPAVNQTYALPGIETKPNFLGAYFILGLISLIGIVNLFFCFKNFSVSKKNSKKNKESYFIYGVLSAVISLFLTGILAGILNLIVVLPIYNITSQF